MSDKFPGIIVAMGGQTTDDLLRRGGEALAEDGLGAAAHFQGDHLEAIEAARLRRLPPPRQADGVRRGRALARLSLRRGA